MLTGSRDSRDFRSLMTQISPQLPQPFHPSARRGCRNVIFPRSRYRVQARFPENTCASSSPTRYTRLCHSTCNLPLPSDPHPPTLPGNWQEARQRLGVFIPTKHAGSWALKIEGLFIEVEIMITSDMKRSEQIYCPLKIADSKNPLNYENSIKFPLRHSYHLDFPLHTFLKYPSYKN